jgi:hypothetical protein
MASAIISISSGALGELICTLGDVRDHDFARLTERLENAPLGLMPETRAHG